jgi:hypothetical protein
MPAKLFAPSCEESAFGQIALNTAGFLQRAFSLQLGVHPAEASSNEVGCTTIGSLMYSSVRYYHHLLT